MQIAPEEPVHEVIQIESNQSTNNVPVTLTWENIEVHTPGSEEQFLGKLAFFRKQVPPRRLVNNVSGVAKPGSLMAIMGASGAGKTTLLNVLNFRNRGSLKINGDVKINGEVVKSREAISTLSGYVQQEDLFIGYLTVKEQLKFQAMMRLSKSLSNEEKMKKVEEIMLEVNLKKCENTLIGFPDRGVKGISGGERRRLAFACELVTDPNLLFLDEPTSGLDSFMAGSLVDCMKKLAEKGKTIICTIHQPPSDVFSMFDQLCLMAEGRLAYLGDLKEAPNFFENIGMSLPVNFNPADHYINSLAVIPTQRDESLKVVEKVCNSFMESDLQKLVQNGIDEANEMPKNENNIQLHLSNSVHYNASFFTQFRWLLWRDYFILTRNPMALKISLAQSILISLMIGLIYLRLSYNQSGVQNINGVLFLLMSNISFNCMFSILNVLPAELPVFMREHQNGLYSVIAPFLIPLMIFSGFFLNSSNIPNYFVWLQYLSYFKYANELLVINQWQTIDQITCEDSASQCFYHNGTEVISYLKFDVMHWKDDFFALSGLLVFLRLFAFLILLAKSYQR